MVYGERDIICNDISVQSKSNTVNNRRRIALFLFEVVLLLGGAIILQAWADDHLKDMPLHPFLVIVAFLAVQYGTIGGVITTLVATIVHLIGQAPERLIGQDYATYNLAIWYDPISWLVTSLLLGIFVDRYLQSMLTLRRELEEKHLELDLIVKHYNVVANRVNRLETHIAGFVDDGAGLSNREIATISREAQILELANLNYITHKSQDS